MAITDQELLPHALSLLHHRVKLAGKAAQQAVALHDLHGPDALRECLQDQMHRGQKPEFLQQVAQSLRHSGRPDIAAIHDETANGW